MKYRRNLALHQKSLGALFYALLHWMVMFSHWPCLAHLKESIASMTQLVNMKQPSDHPLSFTFCSTDPPPLPPLLHPLVSNCPLSLPPSNAVTMGKVVRQVTTTHCIWNRQNICPSLIHWSAEVQPRNGRKEKKFAYLSLPAITCSMLLCI